MFFDEVMKTLPESEFKRKIEKETVVFKIQNVADYVWGDEKTYEGHIGECYSYRLPFELVWFEFREPEIFRIGKKEEKINGERAKIGILASVRGGRFHMMVWIEFRDNEGAMYMGELSLGLDGGYRAIEGYYPVKAKPIPIVKTEKRVVFGIEEPALVLSLSLS